MEPLESESSPRPKGFFRRNWIALLILAAILQLSVVNLRIRTSFHLYIGIYEGDIRCDYVDHPIMQLPGRKQYGFSFEPPKFGDMPRVKRDWDRTTYTCSILFAACICMAFIAIREWRRKRIKAKEPHGTV